jgi:hypothetical protein
MREFRTYGSARGAPSNGRPYRDSGPTAADHDPHQQTLCVQRRLARPVGDSPTGVKVGAP